ncbi:MAG TPA: carboxypeptidase-like regulatory domain-containing protein, partial [Terriglobia bacterium]|nr:carboxypeptidase-like regulatory domain-containing protein [Terriglobia bacterium]
DRSIGSFALMPLDVGPLDNPPATSSTSRIAFSSKPTGEFELRDVEPGRYDLYAMAQDNQNRRFWTGHTIVQITDKDITGLNLELSAGGILAGEISIEGTGPAPLPLERLRIALQPLGTLPAPVGLIMGAIPVDAAGKFNIPAIAEGQYRINVQGLPANAYIADIRQSGVSVFDDGIIFGKGASQTSIQISLKSDGESIEGTVHKRDSKPAAGATIVIVPISVRQQNPALYRTATADADGRFSLTGISPGEYTVFAWESVLTGAWQNAAFLAKYQSRGQTLRVIPQGHAKVQLEVIPAE